ncbi:hypothetical protein HD554DRAFT_2229599 [Boletus coccyginus]|nr:hypothetical protein HD554DRAFT_2229599 [Boletus coccyginus]
MVIVRTQAQQAEKPEVADTNNRFMAKQLASILASPSAKDYNNSEWQAAIRSLLRYGVYEDDTHHHTRTPGGLHPSCVYFNPPTQNYNGTPLLDQTTGDLFDADRLDSGISLLIRCPGFEVPPDVTADQLDVDIYVTPHELFLNKRVNNDTVRLVEASVQVFRQDFALPHLQRFAERCKVESVVPPKRHASEEHVSSHGPGHLPAPLSPGPSRTQLDPAIRVMNTKDVHVSTTMLDTQKVDQMRQRRQRQPAEAFLFSVG